MSTKLREELINIELAILTGEWERALEKYEQVNTNLDQLTKDLTPEETTLILNLIDYIKDLLQERLGNLRKLQALLKVTQSYLRY